MKHFFVTMAVAADLALAAPATSQMTSVNGRIACTVCEYSSVVGDVVCDSWSMNPDGTGHTNLTRTPDVDEAQPAWSADDTKIAFAGVRLEQSVAPIAGDPVTTDDCDCAKAFSVLENSSALSDFRQQERPQRSRRLAARTTACGAAHALPIRRLVWTTRLRLIAEHYPPLASLPPCLRDRLDAEGRPLQAPTGDRLFDVGDHSVAVPLLARGLVRVTRPLPTGRDVPLYMLAAGDFCVLSLAGTLGNVPCPARATVIEAAEGVLLPNALFRAMVDAHEPFRHAVLQSMSIRLLALTLVIEDSAVGTVDKRLAELLVARGPVVHATHQALAEELGTAREVISRILKHFEAQGLVALKRSEVRVTEPQRLVHPVAGREDESA